MKTSHVAHFVVTGEAMTQMARDLLLSDEPGKAYRILADNLCGDGAIEAALKILQGTHDLAGDSSVGLELIEAASTPQMERFKANFAFIYAGRYRTGRGWRRPVAKVVRFGPKDGKWASERVRKGSETMRHWSKERALYYCNGDETVELLDLPDEGNVYIIWEPCSELPHWMKPPTTAQEALDQALAAGRRLEERPSDVEREIEDAETRAQVKVKRARMREDKEREARQEQRQREFEELVASIGPKVRAQAGDDTFPLTLKDGRTLVVPRAPFVRWALRRTDLADRAPDWTNVAPVGVKMNLDNPDHTDWVLGAGLTLDEAYKGDVNDAAWDEAFKIQEQTRSKRPYDGIFAAIEHLNEVIHPAATIVDAGTREGTVGVDISVFPDSDADRVEQLGKSVGVIVEQGGKLAHFAIVTKGKSITVMRHAKACETFKDGTRVQLNPKTGRIVIMEDE